MLLVRRISNVWHLRRRLRRSRKNPGSCYGFNLGNTPREPPSFLRADALKDPVLSDAPTRPTPNRKISRRECRKTRRPYKRNRWDDEQVYRCDAAEITTARRPAKGWRIFSASSTVGDKRDPCHSDTVAEGSDLCRG